MNLFGMFSISASALTAERQRAEVVTANMANAETTRGPDGKPYRRHLVVFRAGAAPTQFPMMLASQNQGTAGVRVDRVVEDTAPPLRRYAMKRRHTIEGKNQKLRLTSQRLLMEGWATPPCAAFFSII